jgi:beta-N-acetylhexosaminidase
VSPKVLRPVTATVLAAFIVGVPTATAAPLDSPVTLATSGASAAPEAPARTADSVFKAMTLRQRIGQLFMVGTPATSASSTTRSEITRYHVGNVMLTGRSLGGTATPHAVAAAMQARATSRATAGVRLLVSTDQEGGLVQVLHGPGISEMPTALTQGQFSLSHLQSSATTWGRQLRRSGVNMNLAPVLDTVPGPTAARHNPPIGVFRREFGYTTARVGRHGTAVARGMAAAGVLVSIKHFPGLGRVTGNTDTTSGVTDTVTRRGDAYFRPFQRAIDSGDVPFVMMSTAYYSHLDKAHPAAFSRFVIGTVLRGDLGFKGAVISDDLAKARQVSRWSLGGRAVRFVRAGGDVVLTVRPGALPAMYDAVLARARTNAGFHTLVDRAALRVLRTKEAHHLLGH